MVLANAGQREELRAGLSQPLRRIEFELTRPYFFGDTAIVTSIAYRTPQSLMFVHDLTGPDQAHHGTVVETFPAG
jgi:hypothetical protein